MRLILASSPPRARAQGSRVVPEGQPEMGFVLEPPLPSLSNQPWAPTPLSPSLCPAALPIPLPGGSAVGRNARVPIVLENVCSRVTGAAILPPSRSLWFVWTAGLLATLWSTLQLAMCLGRVPETACPGRIWVRASHGGSPGAGPHCDSIP